MLLSNYRKQQLAIATGRSVALHRQRLDSAATCQIEHRYLHGTIRRPTPAFRTNRVDLTDERQLGQHRYHLYLGEENSLVSFYRYGSNEKAAIADQDQLRDFLDGRGKPELQLGRSYADRDTGRVAVWLLERGFDIFNEDS